MNSKFRKLIVMGLVGIMGCSTTVLASVQEEKQVTQTVAKIEWLMEPRFEEISGSSENGFCVKENGKWGLIDKSGKWVISPLYDEMRDFYDGLAAVKRGEKWGFINEKGQEVIKCQYGGVTDFSEGVAYISDYEYYEYDGHFETPETAGAIDKTGKLIIDFKKFEKSYMYCDQFSEGLAGLGNPSQYNTDGCYMNKEGKIILKDTYCSVGKFSEGLATIGYYDATQEEILADPEKNAEYKYPYKLGYINTKGERVLENLPYITIGDFHEGLAYVQNTEGKWGCINQKGNLVIPCIYESLWDAHEGMIGFKKDELMGYLDLTGKVVIKNQYDGITSFYGGMALVQKHGASKVSVIDKKGNIIIEEQENINISTKGEYIYILKDNKWGIVKNPLLTENDESKVQ